MHESTPDSHTHNARVSCLSSVPPDPELCAKHKVCTKLVFSTFVCTIFHIQQLCVLYFKHYICMYYISYINSE